jgi:hypothetical protein
MGMCLGAGTAGAARWVAIRYIDTGFTHLQFIGIVYEHGEASRSSSRQFAPVVGGDGAVAPRHRHL